MPTNRASLLAEAESHLRKSTFTKEDSSRVENLIRLADSLSDKNELRKARLAEYSRELGRPTLEASQPVDAQFLSYLRDGKDALAIRGAQSTTTTAGGYLVPAAFADTFATALAQYDNLFEVATLVETTSGTAFNYPIVDDIAESAAVVAENNTSSAGDVVFAALAFGKCPLWRSGLVRASTEVVSDSAFPFDTLLAQAFAVRIARGVGEAFVATLLSSAVAGKTATSATVIAADELFDLAGSVDSAYGMNGSWLMKFSTYISILKLKASTGGQYVFEVEQDAGGRPLLLGFPVYLSPSMGAMTSGEKPVTFGDHSRFIRRQVRNSFAVKTYVERYAEYSQLAYEAFLRVDGDLAKTATSCPVKFLQMA
jgi:HK97 family phage major capsid protein